MSHTPPDKVPSESVITRDPFPSSAKFYAGGGRPDLRVAMREITLQSSAYVAYDTSGPYTDPLEAIDIRQGLKPIRKSWIEERADTDILPEITSSYGRERLKGASLD